MSVAIVSSPVKPAVTTTPADAPAAAEPASAGADFASLLHGQLALGLQLQPAAPQTPAEPLSVKADDDLVATQAGAQDAALMLAALGLTPQAPTSTADTTKAILVTGLPPADLTVSIASRQTTPGVPDPAIEARKGAGLPALAAVDDKPAIFAVPGRAIPIAELPVHDVPLSDTPVGGLATLAAHAPNNLESAARNSQTPLKIETPIRDSAWASDFGQKIVWLAANDKQSAQLTLNPPHMGPIEISLNLNKDTASAFFVSPNAEVRETIEAALPRLREMLAGVGIELGQANVGAESFRQQAGNETARQGSPRWMGDNAILGADAGRQLSGQTIAVQRGNGMVDTFA